MRTFILGLCTVATMALAAGPAAATVNTNDEWKVRVTGQGAKTFGKSINIAFSLSNTAVNNTIAPDRMSSFTISSPTVRWNRRGYRVKTCNNARTTDGSSIKCSRSTRVGSGKFKGVVGIPGQSLFIFGALSEFTGTLQLYNYKRASGTTATLIAEGRISSPSNAAGTYFTVPVPIDRRGNVEVVIPKLSELPTQVSTLYQPNARAILTDLSTTIKSPRTRTRRQKPFASINIRKGIGATVKVVREDG